MEKIYYQVIVLFIVLNTTILALMQFAINMVYKKDKYYIYPWIYLSTFLWTLLYYLTHTK